MKAKIQVAQVCQTEKTDQRKSLLLNSDGLLLTGNIKKAVLFDD